MQVVGIQPAQIATANVFVKRTTVSAAVIEKEWMLMSHDGQLKRERGKFKSINGHTTFTNVTIQKLDRQTWTKKHQWRVQCKTIIPTMKCPINSEYFVRIAQGMVILAKFIEFRVSGVMYVHPCTDESEFGVEGSNFHAIWHLLQCSLLPLQSCQSVIMFFQQSWNRLYLSS